MRWGERWCLVFSSLSVCERECVFVRNRYPQRGQKRYFLILNSMERLFVKFNPKSEIAFSILKGS